MLLRRSDNYLWNDWKLSSGLSESLLRKSYPSVHLDTRRSERSQGHKLLFTFYSFCVKGGSLNHDNKISHLRPSRPWKRQTLPSTFPPVTGSDDMWTCTFFFLFQQRNCSENFQISHIVAPLSHILSLSAAFSPFSHLWNAFSRSSSYFSHTVGRTFFIRSQLSPYFTPCQPQVLAEGELRSA